MADPFLTSTLLHLSTSKEHATHTLDVHIATQWFRVLEHCVTWTELFHQIQSRMKGIMWGKYLTWKISIKLWVWP